jgi:hypothetical protein
MLGALKDGAIAIYLNICRPACCLLCLLLAACFFILFFTTMSLQPGNGDLSEKHTNASPSYESKQDGHFGSDPENMVVASENVLHKDLKGRHMQMIAMQVKHSELSSTC